MDALEFHYVGLVGLANTFENRPAEFKRILYIKRGLKSELDHKNEGQVQILGRRSVSSSLTLFGILTCPLAATEHSQIG